MTVRAQTRSAVGRLANIDRLRLLALLEIIVFHTTLRTGNGIHVLGGIGLPIFLLFTVALNARPRTGESAAAVFRRKSAMFLIPWAAWSLVYAAANTVAALAKGAAPFKWFKADMILVGTQTHLWYLVFALLASLAAMAGYRATARVKDQGVVVGGGLLACALLVGEQLLQVDGAWATDWLIAVPAIPLGLALGRCIHAATARERTRRMTLLALIVGPTLTVLAQTDLGYSASRFALAIIPITLVVLWPGRPDRVTTEMTQLRLGVYLVHMLIISGMHFAHLEGLNIGLRSAIAIAGSFMAAWAIAASPLRWMVQPNALKFWSRPAVDGDKGPARDAVGG